MAAPIKTRLDAIVLACQARLVEILRWPEERVLVADPDDVDPVPTAVDGLCCLWPESASIRHYEAAGRYRTAEDVRLVVAVYTRLAVDAKPSGRAWLTGAGRGHLIARHRVLDALVAFQPVDEESNWLCQQPIAPAPNSKPKRDRKTPGWGESRLTFQFVYDLDLDITNYT